MQTSGAMRRENANCIHVMPAVRNCALERSDTSIASDASD